MTKSFLLFLLTTLLPMVAGGQPDRSIELSSYAYCHFNGGMSVASVDRMPGRGLRYRTVQTRDGSRRVSMIDGYRVMLAYPAGTYFANMHVEESRPSQYSADKEAVIKSLATLVDGSGTPMLSEHRNYSGFDTYYSNDSTMNGNGPSGMYVLFRDSTHLIVTIYFLNQKQEDRQFTTIDQYNTLRDGVLKDFTTCANAATAQTGVPPVRPDALPVGKNFTVDSFDSVSHWHTNPSSGVEIALHPDSGLNGRGMRVDFDFHGHGGYAIVNRRLELDLPANYEFAFALRGSAPTNTLEFKLVDPTGANVWWSNNPDFVFSPEWRTITRKKREICFAWGPVRGGEIHRLAAIELAITAGSGGKGTIWIDDLSLTALDPDSPFNATAPVASVPIVGTWDEAPVARGGLWSSLDFTADGSVTAMVGANTRFDFSVVDNHLTTIFKNPNSGKSEIDKSLIRIQHDTLTQDNGSGTVVIMKRVRPAKSGDDPIIGSWTYADYKGAAAFVEFGRNGRGMLVQPFSSCSGKWALDGDHLTVRSNGQPAQHWGYSIRDGVLTTRDAQGREASLNRRTPE